jgi:hypothetical protein
VIDKEIFSLLNTIDLCQHGFVLGYEVWRFYGELGTQAIEEEEEDYSIGFDRMDEILEAIQIEITKDCPTKEVEVFFKLLKARRVVT